MRKITKIIGVVLAIGSWAMACGVTGKGGHTNGEGSRHEEDIFELEFSGDTLSQYDGKTYIQAYWDDKGDLLGKFSTFIVTCRGNEAIDTCRVEGESAELSAEGKTLKVAVGVDTAYYDITNLPKRIDPIRRLLPEEYRKQSVEHSFALRDSGWICQFRLYCYLPERYPEWLNQFVASALYSEQQRWMSESDSPNFINEYQLLIINPKRYRGLDTSKTNMEEIGRYFARRFEQLYRAEFEEEDMEDGWGGPLYEYSFEVAPAWTSDDGKLATYRFYSYSYGGGVHGMMYEYYLTFETSSGRILGRKDLFDDAGFETAMRNLSEKIDIRGDYEPGYQQRADIGRVDENYTSLREAYEEFKGCLYPRPALLEDRMVFSYQPYDKGCFADGILHFVLPYSIK